MLNLIALGHHHPENVLDNAFFESLDIGTNDQWIVSRVGVHQRRTVLPLDYIRETKNADIRQADRVATVSNPESGARAARMAVERAGIDMSEVGMVIAGGCCPRWSSPAEASAIARLLELEVPAFDVQAACSTFGLQLHVARQMADALPDYVLCICAESNTRTVDYSDRSSCVWWGDGSSAALGATKHPGKARILDTTFGAAPSGAMDVVIPRAGHFTQHGGRVHKFAIKRMTSLFRDCRALLPADRADELVYVGHQANGTMLDAVTKRCQVPAELHWKNIEKFGNQGSAGAPVVVSQRWDDIAPGTHVATIVVGAGLSWSRVLMRFAG